MEGKINGICGRPRDTILETYRIKCPYQSIIMRKNEKSSGIYGEYWSQWPDEAFTVEKKNSKAQCFNN